MFEKNNVDYITINTKDGMKRKAELVSKFEIEQLGEYIIYKLDGKYYGAKYYFDGNDTNLITDLCDAEKKVINEIFMQLGVK